MNYKIVDMFDHLSKYSMKYKRSKSSSKYRRSTFTSIKRRIGKPSRTKQISFIRLGSIVSIQSVENRKKLIRGKLKKIGLNQQEFGKVLGHDSKSYLSELINGIILFSLKDLVVISKLFTINLSKLIPTQIAEEE